MGNLALAHDSAAFGERKRKNEGPHLVCPCEPTGSTHTCTLRAGSFCQAAWKRSTSWLLRIIHFQHESFISARLFLLFRPVFVTEVTGASMLAALCKLLAFAHVRYHQGWAKIHFQNKILNSRLMTVSKWGASSEKPMGGACGLMLTNLLNCLAVRHHRQQMRTTETHRLNKCSAYDDYVTFFDDITYLPFRPIYIRSQLCYWLQFIIECEQKEE